MVRGDILEEVDGDVPVGAVVRKLEDVDVELSVRVELPLLLQPLLQIVAAGIAGEQDRLAL